jgi:hypothetical protein
MEQHSFVILPEQGVWLPTGLAHRISSLFGAEFHSLWDRRRSGARLPAGPTVFSVLPLLQALIDEAAEIEGQEDSDGYVGRVTDILDQLQRAKPLSGALLRPRGGSLAAVGEALSADLANPRSPEKWGQELGTLGRTLALRFEAELA